MDALADQELTEGDAQNRSRRGGKGKLTRFEEVVGAPERVAEIAGDIVAHFEQRRGAMAGGKGMIVAIRRRVAVDLFDQIAALRPQWVSTDPQDDVASLLRSSSLVTGNRTRRPCNPSAQ